MKTISNNAGSRGGLQLYSLCFRCLVSVLLLLQLNHISKLQCKVGLRSPNLVEDSRFSDIHPYSSAVVTISCPTAISNSQPNAKLVHSITCLRCTVCILYMKKKVFYTFYTLHIMYGCFSKLHRHSLLYVLEQHLDNSIHAHIMKSLYNTC